MRFKIFKSLLHKGFRGYEAVTNFMLLLLSRQSGVRGANGGRRARILLLRPDSIGDMLLFSATLPVYRDLFPSCEIVLIVREEVAGVVAGSPFVDEVWPLDVRRFRRNLPERWSWFRKVSGGGFEIAVNTAYSNHFPELDCLIGWTGAGRRVAHSCSDEFGMRRRAWPHYTELAPSTMDVKFEIDRNHDLVRYLGFKGPVSRATAMWTGIPHSIHQSQTRDGSQPYAVLCPGARIPEKVWDAENFAQVARHVSTSVRMRWVVCGDDSQHELCNRVVHRMRSMDLEAENVAGLTSIQRLGALIQGAQICLGNDSGPLHIAAAVGTPGVCVLGGGHFGRFYPYPGNPLTVAEYKMLP